MHELLLHVLVVTRAEPTNAEILIAVDGVSKRRIRKWRVETVEVPVGLAFLAVALNDRPATESRLVARAAQDGLALVVPKPVIVLKVNDPTTSTSIT